MGFYHLADLPSARATRKRHEAFLKGKDVRGRIYVAPQGINAQFSAPAVVAAEYLIWVGTRARRRWRGKEEGEGGKSAPQTPSPRPPPSPCSRRCGPTPSPPPGASTSSRSSG